MARKPPWARQGPYGKAGQAVCAAILVAKGKPASITTRTGTRPRPA
jgi:hypothetical protein